MRRSWALAVASAVVANLCAHAATASTVPSARRYKAVVSEVHVVVDDGVQLSVTLAEPSQDGRTRASGRFGGVLSMTPYDKDGAMRGFAPHPEYFAERGYLRAIVDVRGTGTSGGTKAMTWSPREQVDTAEMVEWLAHRASSNGEVALFGGSWLGIIQYFAAALAPPHLRAIVPIVAMSDLYRDATYHGGMLSALSDAEVAGGVGALPSIAGPRRIPPPASIEKAPPFRPGGCRPQPTASSSAALAAGVAASSTDDLFYRSSSPYWFASCIKVPAMIIDGWFDGFERGAFEMYGLLSARPDVETQLWVDATSHYPESSLTYKARTADSHLDNPRIEQATLAFLGRHIAGLGHGASSAAHLEVIGASGEVLSSPQVPPPGFRLRRLYMGSATLGPVVPAAGSSTYLTNPVSGWTDLLSRHGNLATVTPYDPLDQRLEGHDGLAWRTPPLRCAATLAGGLAVHLVAASSASDTDWVVRVSDVSPDASAQLVTEGWLRASHRTLDQSRTTPDRPFHTHLHPTPIAPGQAYHYDIEIWPTAIRLPAGHRLQIQLASNDTPNHLPARMQLGTDVFATFVDPNQLAENTVLTGGAEPSFLVVPVADDCLS